MPPRVLPRDTVLSCPYPDCSRRLLSFPNLSRLHRHLAKHDLSFICTLISSTPLRDRCLALLPLPCRHPQLRRPEDPAAVEDVHRWPHDITAACMMGEDFVAGFDHSLRCPHGFTCRAVVSWGRWEVKNPVRAALEEIALSIADHIATVHLHSRQSIHGVPLGRPRNPKRLRDAVGAGGAAVDVDVDIGDEPFVDVIGHRPIPDEHDEPLENGSDVVLGEAHVIEVDNDGSDDEPEELLPPVAAAAGDGVVDMDQADRDLSDDDDEPAEVEDVAADAGCHVLFCHADFRRRIGCSTRGNSRSFWFRKSLHAAHNALKTSVTHRVYHESVIQHRQQLTEYSQFVWSRVRGDVERIQVERRLRKYLWFVYPLQLDTLFARARAWVMQGFCDVEDVRHSEMPDGRDNDVGGRMSLFSCIKIWMAHAQVSRHIHVETAELERRRKFVIDRCGNAALYAHDDAVSWAFTVRDGVPNPPGEDVPITDDVYIGDNVDSEFGFRQYCRAVHNATQNGLLPANGTAALGTSVVVVLLGMGADDFALKYRHTSATSRSKSDAFFCVQLVPLNVPHGARANINSVCQLPHLVVRRKALTQYWKTCHPLIAKLTAEMNEGAERGVRAFSAHLQKYVTVVPVFVGMVGDMPGRLEILGMKRTTDGSISFCQYCDVTRSNVAHVSAGYAVGAVLRTFDRDNTEGLLTHLRNASRLGDSAARQLDARWGGRDGGRQLDYLRSERGINEHSALADAFGVNASGSLPPDDRRIDYLPVLAPIEIFHAEEHGNLYEEFVLLLEALGEALSWSEPRLLRALGQTISAFPLQHGQKTRLVPFQDMGALRGMQGKAKRELLLCCPFLLRALFASTGANHEQLDLHNALHAKWMSFCTHVRLVDVASRHTLSRRQVRDELQPLAAQSASFQLIAHGENFFNRPNAHLSMHYGQMWRLHGPMRATWSYGYENANANLKAAVERNTNGRKKGFAMVENFVMRRVIAAVVGHQEAMLPPRFAITTPMTKQSPGEHVASLIRDALHEHVDMVRALQDDSAFWTTSAVLRFAEFVSSRESWFILAPKTVRTGVLNVDTELVVRFEGCVCVHDCAVNVEVAGEDLMVFGHVAARRPAPTVSPFTTSPVYSVDESDDGFVVVPASAVLQGVILFPDGDGQWAHLRYA